MPLPDRAAGADRGGVLLWLGIPMDPTIHTIIRVVVMIVVVIWLLRAFGLLGAIGGLTI
jgi:hypothetical protein